MNTPRSGETVNEYERVNAYIALLIVLHKALINTYSYDYDSKQMYVCVPRKGGGEN